MYPWMIIDMKTFKEYLTEKVTSAGLILTDGKVLLAGRATGLGKYDLPKGRIDPGETALQAVVRETFEETNLKVTPKDLTDLGMFKYSSSKNLHLFLMKTDKLPDVKKMKCTSYFTDHNGTKTLEIDKHKYIKIEDLNKYMQDNLVKAIEKALKERL